MYPYNPLIGAAMRRPPWQVARRQRAESVERATGGCSHSAQKSFLRACVVPPAGYRARYSCSAVPSGGGVPAPPVSLNRFVRVIRVPACARVSRVSRVCPGSPRCLFTGTAKIRATGTGTVYRYR